MTAELASWKYYKNDIWRFPIGNNPNYGMDLGSGIVFSGSIPFFCIIFPLEDLKKLACGELLGEGMTANDVPLTCYTFLVS